METSAIFCKSFPSFESGPPPEIDTVANLKSLKKRSSTCDCKKKKASKLYSLVTDIVSKVDRHVLLDITESNRTRWIEIGARSPPHSALRTELDVDLQRFLERAGAEENGFLSLSLSHYNGMDVFVATGSRSGRRLLALYCVYCWYCG